MQKNTDNYKLKKANGSCQIRIPQIVEKLRMQSFFMASNMLTELIRDLNMVASEWTDAEFLMILQCVVKAQEQKDYIFLADILEGDLLPLLQKLQVEILGDTKDEYDSFWKENIRVLRETGCLFVQQLEMEEDDLAYYVMPAVNGQVTLKYQTDTMESFLHSSINPQREAELFARKYIQKECQEYYMFGMGMGYHILAILQESRRNRVIVLEHQLEVLRLALRYQDFSKYLKAGQLQIIWNRDVGKLLRQMDRKEESTFVVHYPSLFLLPPTKEKELLENYFMSVNTMLEQQTLLEDNFWQMQDMNLQECGVWKETFAGKDIVIVAGGPSLDTELESLRRYQKDVVVFAVGTVARKLVENGITPDAIIISDPQEHMYRQVEGLENLEIPVFLLSTASAEVVNHYAGDCYIAYQEGYALAEKVAEMHGYMLFQTGGSVTTLALDMAIQFAAERIILVGADMAYTNQQSHAEGLGRSVAEEKNVRLVEAVDGTMIQTAQNLDIYRKWIEKRIEAIQIPIYNTARGARIAGTKEDSLEKIVHT